MTDWVWISSVAAHLIHEEQLAEHGGLQGVRDEGMLESALSRPQNIAAYGESTVSKLAAGYAFGIARNHPFADGNKRTALVVAELFLDLNGYELLASDPECVVTILRLAAGELSEDDLADWIQENTARR